MDVCWAVHFIDQFGRYECVFPRAAIQHHLAEVPQILRCGEKPKLWPRIFLTWSCYVHYIFYKLAVFKVVHRWKAINLAAIGEEGAVSHH